MVEPRMPNGTPRPPIGRRRAATLRLRDETRDLHEAIERNAIAERLVATDVTIDDHRRMHVRLHAHHSPTVAWLEGAIANTLPEVLPGLRDLVARLERDLEWLGVDPRTIAPAPLGFEGQAAAGACGVVYVLEGSRLGGRIIARHLADRLELGPTSGAAFYAEDADGPRIRWPVLCDRLDTLAEDLGPDAADAMVSGARLAFASLDHWLREA
jgi:heme oxygenase (biliverdin-IX-beta and delta-forming)